MRVRLLAVAVAAGLSIAPLSGLACELACLPDAAGEGAVATHAGCHEPSGTSSTAVQQTGHHCDHAALTARFADRAGGKLTGAVPGATPTSVHLVRTQAALGVPLACASPPRSAPLQISSVSIPLRV